MRFNTELEKQIYIYYLEKEISEITKDEYVSGWVKHHVEMAQFCHKLENQLKKVEDFEVKTKIINALMTVERLYENRLRERIERGSLENDKAKVLHEIDLMRQSLNMLEYYAPTETTRLLYIAFVEEHSESLQRFVDSKPVIPEAYISETLGIEPDAHDIMMKNPDDSRSSASPTNSIPEMLQTLQDMNDKIIQMLEVQKRSLAEMETMVNARLNTVLKPGTQEATMNSSKVLHNRFFTDKSENKPVFHTVPSIDYHN